MPETTLSALPPSLDDKLRHMAEQCILCPKCVRECAFLQQRGKPGDVAKAVLSGDGVWPLAAYDCNLCGLCRAVCPVDLDPAALFLELRRWACETGQLDESPYKVLLNFEQRGLSRRYAFHALPPGCDTVFFPGCNLPGTRPKRTWETFQYLRDTLGNVGMVLDCCGTPSHSLGRPAFRDIFSTLLGRLRKAGIRRVIVACPNCTNIFRRYGEGLEVLPIAPLLAETPPTALADARTDAAEWTVHDPCPMRDETPTHKAVRRVAELAGVPLAEPKHAGTKTLCCGEGGGVGFVRRDLSDRWKNLRLEEAETRTMLTYCAGCVRTLSPKRSVHLLDLAFDPDRALAGKARSSGAAMAYLNRILLKRKLRRWLAGHNS